MKRLIFSLPIVILIFAGCGKAPEKKELTVIKPADKLSEQEMLLGFLEKHGNYINDAETPNLVQADEVFANLANPAYYFIDMRPAEDFEKGHVSAAYNIKFAELLNHFRDSINPSLYDKIIMICKDGQTASYATALLRLAGYGNVFALKWGMASWNKQFSGYWSENTSSAYEKNFDTVAVSQPAAGSYPVLKTGAKSPEKILQKRIEALFAEEQGSFRVKAENVLTDSGNLFIINYSDTNKYNSGHLKGAVLYKNRESLLSTASLKTLPTDKKIVVYCETGTKAAFVTAYLRLLGYDAYAIAYGINGLIYNTAKNNGWPVYSAEASGDFPVITGSETIVPKVEVTATTSQSQSAAPATNNPPVKKQKKSASGGCG
ncbi:MAG TPA: hypothetical protein DEA97_04490 [Bacteroidales bacterium]|nr:hypothetical protein [Bacteroidales bacterium]